MRIFLAFKVFFAVLFNSTKAGNVRLALEDKRQPTAAEREEKAVRPEPPRPKPPIRSDAVSLLAALQREARFVDLAMEPLDNYTDEQVGAAARDVLRDCRKVLDRLLALAPVVEQSEGAEIEVPAGFDTGQFRLTGNVAGQPPFHGSLVHHGWRAEKCEIPEWSGSETAAPIVAPAEIELA